MSSPTDSDGSVEYENVTFRCSLSSSGAIVQPSLPTTQTSFQIARPVIKHRRWLLLNPKMVYQVQQVASEYRPRPVLEFWVRPFRRSKLLPGFIPYNKFKRRGIYAATCEPYHIKDPLLDQRARSPPDSPECAFEEHQVVAILNREQLADNHPTVMHLRDGAHSWEMVETSELGVQCYRFFLLDQCEQGIRCCFSHFQWKRRDCKGKDDEFVLLLIDRRFAHESEIAVLTRSELLVTIYENSIVEKLRTLQHLTFASLSEGNTVPSTSSEWVWSRLYTHILIFAVMVAYKERWL